MLHEIPVDQLGPRGQAMTDAVQACVHCGFCLPTCPTYRNLGEEMDSPRGRIFLIKQVLEGKLKADEAQKHIDRCLGCLACETSCPSGVKYGELISPYRAKRRSEGAAGGNSLRRWLTALTVPFPDRFRWAMRLGKIGRMVSFLTPASLRPMLEMVPARLPASQPLAERYSVTGTPNARVGLLIGCAQQVLAPNINVAAIRVLVRNGVEVVVPRAQACCGALSWHIGDDKSATAFARNNLRAFPDELDHIITTAAGCGSGLHDYPLILAGSDQEQAAHQFAKKTLDISAFLDSLEMEIPPPLKRTVRVAYHDACHLSHAQRVRQPPRRILRKISGLDLVEISNSDICCGSAGTYNIDHPEIAHDLGRSKAREIIETGAELVVLGNIGCQVQIERHLRELGSQIRVIHTIELLDHVYRGTFE
jgi:glycolate oxidase iron-sulfur subunit